MILLSKYPAVNAAIARLEYLKINRELQKKIKKEGIRRIEYEF
jgi:hypothetical protein